MRNGSDLLAYAEAALGLVTLEPSGASFPSRVGTGDPPTDSLTDTLPFFPSLE